MSTITELLPLLRGEMSKMRIPHGHDKVYKDECVYSFDSPYSDTGLYVNTITFAGVGVQFLSTDAQKSGCKIYLHEKWTQVPRPEPEVSADAPSKLAIGVEGGFADRPKFDVVQEYAVVIVKSPSDLVTVPFPNSELPEFISNVLNGIIAHKGMKETLQVASWEADQEKIISKYADRLEQVNPSGKRIPQDPKQWKDEASDATDNLWLNLSTGYIGGGRRNWDGSGGSGSALQHYLDTGRRYPLVVKLGTITPHGADVWSYAEDEDCLVIDPKLADHLSFWGIDIMKLEKTDKSLGEMEVALNVSYDWSRLMEGQEELELLSGPGFVGLRNIGSSCYLNAAVQTLLSIPEVQERYLHRHPRIVESLPASATPATDVTLQLSKVADALFSKKYVPSVEEARAAAESAKKEDFSGNISLLEKYIIAPRMFKHAVAREHAEFSSGRQQDASEYLQHLLEVLRREERVALSRFDDHPHIPTNALFEYHIEQRLKHLDSAQVKLSRPGPGTLQSVMSLPIPLDRREPLADEANDAKRPRLLEGADAANPLNKLPAYRVPFEACLEAWQGNEVVQVTHPSLGPQPFLRTQRFLTFPRYLWVKLERYYLAENWVQQKISGEVPMPLELDLEPYRATGLQAGETEITESAAPASTTTAPAAIEADAGLVAQIVSMGFSENGARRAAIATQNADAEIALSWVFEHMNDADFNDPPAAPSTGSAATQTGPAVDAGAVEMLQAMGFTADQCRAALIATQNNAERAADWLFSREGDLDAAVAAVLNPAAAPASSSSSEGRLEGLAAEGGAGRYTLIGMISHIGKNAEHGHYICHVRRGDRWVLFNDEKVGASTRPPLEHGFLYLYRRNDGPGTFHA